MNTQDKEKLRLLWQEILRKRADLEEMNWLAEGGNSIRTMKLIGGIREVFGVQLSFSDVMHHPAIDAQWILICQRMVMKGLPVIQPVPFSASFPLSEIQKAIYLSESIRQGEGIYNLYTLINCIGQTDIKGWEHALSQLVRRHEVLRTVFRRTGEGELLQHVREPNECRCEVQERSVSGYGPAVELAEKCISRPIDTSIDIPIHLVSIRYAPHGSLLLLKVHHLAGDGASLGLLINELYAHYNGFKTGMPAEPGSASLRYLDHVVWESRLISDPAFGLFRKFWQDQFSGRPANPELPFAAPRPASLSADGKTLEFELGDVLFDKLSGLGTRVGVGPFTALLSAIAMTLCRITGEPDITVGMPVSLRRQSGTESLIGPLINTLPVRIDTRPQERLDQYLQRLEQHIALCLDHADYPLQFIVNDLGLSAQANRSPLFDIVVNYQPGDLLIQKADLAGDLTAELVIPQNIPVKYDIGFNFFEFPDAVRGYIEYNMNLFERTAIEKLLVLVKDLVGRITLRLDEKVMDVMAAVEEPEWGRKIASGGEAATDGEQNSGWAREGTLATPTEMRLAHLWDQVLDTKEVKREDNFFRAGGNSIKATKLAMAVHRHLKRKIDIRTIFLKPRLWEIAKEIDDGVTSGYGAIQPVRRAGIHPLSSAQRRIWILSQWSEQNALFNIAGAFHFKKELDRKKLEWAVAALMDRHEILRTSFHLQENEPVQCIHPNGNHMPVRYYSYSDGLSHPAAELLFVQEGQRPFDLQEVPLFRLLVVEETPGECYICLIIHHIIADGWSIMNMVEEFVRDYCFSGHGADPDHPPAGIQYQDFVAWQKAFVENDQSIRESRDWWISRMALLPPAVDLPADRPRPSIRQFRGNTISRSLPRATVNQIDRYTIDQEVSHFIFFAAILAILINKYTGSEDIPIGTAVAGREHMELKTALGIYINLLPLRIRLDPGDTLAAFLSQVKLECLESFDHRLYPFDLLVEALAAGQDMSRNPLFDTLLLVHDFEEAGYRERLERAGVQAMPWRLPVSKYDLTVSVLLLKGAMTIEIEYNTGLFEQPRIEQLLDHLLVIGETFCSGYSGSIGSISLLRPVERERLLYGLNDTRLALPEQSTILSLIAAQVQRHPDKPAIHDDALHLSYGDVWRYAGKLAGLLDGQFQLGPGDIAVVYLSRSCLVPVVYLGILSTGAAFVPVDANFPQERVGFIAKDVNAKVVLTDLDSSFPGFPVLRLSGLTEVAADPIGTGTPWWPHREPDPGSVAYIIYTSGSTGLPKGVAVTHLNLLNFALGISGALGWKENDHLLAATSISFDISLLEMLWTLSQGMEITIAAGLLNGLIGLDRYAGGGINTLQTTPSLLRLLLADLEASRFLSTMENILIGGEALADQLTNELWKVTSARIYNAYGPTETTIWSTIKQLEPGGRVTAGIPIGNSSIYILDKAMDILPPGLIGEVYIGGRGVAKEYLGRRELTAQKFLTDPFLDWPEGRMYATGDMGYWNFSGELQITGRKDRQLKVNGFRIEPAEIEQALCGTGLVTQAAVSLVQIGDEQVLTAWMIPSRNFDVKTDLLPGLNRKLPGYMLPHRFFLVDSFPVTHNGKLDWDGLKRYGRPAETTSPIAHKQPGTVVQRQLEEMARKMLDRDAVGIDENFFEMGGNSIKAIRFLAGVRAAFSVNIDAGMFFREPTIEFASTEIENHRMMGSLQKNIDFAERTESFTV